QSHFSQVLPTRNPFPFQIRLGGTSKNRFQSPALSLCNAFELVFALLWMNCPKEKVAMRDSPQRWLTARPSATVIDLARKASAKKFAYKEVSCGEISRWCRRRPKKVTLSNTQQRL